ncbi:MAG: protein kinase, partial [Planctomycetota bacterium]|nr:protein kinase [Planctomycetota bacterium]
MTSHDSEIGGLAIEKNWITPEQFNECREAQDAAAKLGVQGRLLDIMVQRGVLSQEQANKLERAATGQTHKIEGYHLLTKLGAGGMGAVYKARQEGMNREVAVKILPPKFASNQTFLDRFYREAQSMAKLQHPNI